MTAPDAGQAAEDAGNQPCAHINPDMSGSHRTRYQAHMRTERRVGARAKAAQGLSPASTSAAPPGSSLRGFVVQAASHAAVTAIARDRSAASTVMI